MTPPSLQRSTGPEEDGSKPSISEASSLAEASGAPGPFEPAPAFPRPQLSGPELSPSGREEAALGPLRLGLKKGLTLSRLVWSRDWEGIHERFDLHFGIKLPFWRRRPSPVSPTDPEAFVAWQRLHPTPSPRHYAQALRQARHRPRFSVLVPVYDVPEPFLDACVRSVLGQYYPELELCLVNDASRSPHVRPALERWARSDPRVRVKHLEKNLGIAGASQAALDMATGEYVALLDNDDELAPEALAEMALAICRAPEADWLYSDFVFRREDGCLANPFFKPDWSPERLMAQMYVNHLQVIRTELARRVGGFRKGFDGSQDYDLALRLMEQARSVVHVPRPLYYWRRVPGSTSAEYRAKPYANENAIRALRSALCRRGLARPLDGGEGAEACDVKVESGYSAGTFRIDYKLPHKRPLVSLIIPFRDQWDVTKRCVESIVRRSTYQELELLLVDNGSSKRETEQGLRQFCAKEKRAKLLRYDHPFNHSAINNFAAAQSRGEVLVLLNNDTEAETPDWLERMLMHALKPEIGCVGAQLLYPQGLVQHAGVILGIGGVAGHAFKLFPRAEHGYFSWIHSVVNVSAVTAACLMVRKELYDRVGGFDAEHLPASFNDVDLCLRVRRLGVRNVYTGHAVLLHHESLTRGLDVEEIGKSARFMMERWGADLTDDPYYSPNLSLDREDFAFCVPAR